MRRVSVWLFLGALLAIASVLVVALPFLRRPALPPAEDRLDEPDAVERRRVELAEERDRTLAALKELEFDHRTGKVSDEDYRTLVGPLRRRAAETLRALDERPPARAAARPPGTVARTTRPTRSVKEGDMTAVAAEASERTPQGRQLHSEPTAVVEPPQVPEPMPVPSEPPGPVTVPEPSPVPSEPPMPVPAPDPTPEPSPPQPEPPPQSR